MSRLVPLYQEIAAKDSSNFAGLSVLQHGQAGEVGTVLGGDLLVERNETAHLFLR